MGVANKKKSLDMQSAVAMVLDKDVHVNIAAIKFDLRPNSIRAAIKREQKKRKLKLGVHPALMIGLGAA